MAFSEFSNTTGGSIFDRQQTTLGQPSTSILNTGSGQPTSIFDAGETQDPRAVEQFDLGRRAAVGTPPEQLARRRDLAQRVGLPEEFVVGVEEEAQLRAERKAFEEAQREGLTATTNLLSDPKNSQIAGDLVEEMSAIERRYRLMQSAMEGDGIAGAIGDVAEGVAAFAGTAGAQFDSAFGGVMQMMGEDMFQSNVGQMALVFQAGLRSLTGDAAQFAERARADSERMTEQGRALYEPALRDIAAARADLDPAGKFAFDLAQAIADVGVSYASSVITRTPATGMAYMGLSVLGPTYAEGRMSGMAHEEAAGKAYAYAVFEAVPEYIPLGVMMKKGGKFLWNMTKSAGAEGAQEMLTEALQIGYDMGVLNEEMTWGQAVEQILYSGLLGAVAGGSIRTAGGLVEVLSTGTTDAPRQRAASFHERAQQLAQAMFSSDLGSRDPSLAAKFAGEIISGGSLTPNVYVSAQALEDHFRQNGGRRQFYDALGLNDGDLMDRIALGDDVRMTGEQFARLVLLDETMADVLEHTRFGGETALTAAEAKALGKQDDTPADPAQRLDLPVTPELAEATDAALRDAARVEDSEPPVPEGMVRMYHGGAEIDGARWFSSDREYAEGYAANNEASKVWYVDIPRDDPIFDSDYADQTVDQGFTVQAELDAERSMQAREVQQQITPEEITTPRYTGTLTLLHGTNDATFERFDPAMVKRGSQGQGFYFAQDESLASDYGEHVRKFDVEIKNPIIKGGGRVLTEQEVEAIRNDLVGTDYDAVISVGKNGRIIEVMVPNADQIKPNKPVENPTEGAVDLAERMLGLKAFFANAKEAGMTDKEYTSYVALLQRRAQQAVSRVEVAKLAEEKKRNSAEYKAAREKVRAEVAEEMLRSPYYRAVEFLSRSNYRLDKAAVLETLGNEAQLDLLPKLEGRRLMYTTRSNEVGVHPVVVADVADMSVGELLWGLTDLAPFEVSVERETEKEMRFRGWNSLLDRNAEIEAAIAELQKDETLDVLATEVNAMRKLTRSKRTKDEATGDITVEQPEISAKIVKAAAAERLANMRVADVSENKLTVLASRHSTEARKLLRKGDLEGATRAKFQQLVATAMAHEARRVRRKMEVNKKYLKQFDRDGKKFEQLEVGYIDRIRAALSKFNLGQTMSKDKADDMLNSLNAWAKRHGTLVVLPKQLLRSRRKDWRELTVKEFSALTRFVRDIEQQGIRAKQFRLLGELRQLDEVVTGLVAEVNRNADIIQTKRREEQLVEHQNLHGFQDVLSNIASLEAKFRKIEILLRELDGGVSGGPWNRAIMEPISRAQAAQEEMLHDVLRPLVRSLETLPGQPLRHLRQEKFIPELGRYMSKGELLMLALNSGNASNLNKMVEGSAKDDRLRGGPWTSEAIYAALNNHLTKEDGAWVQSVWDAFDKVLPMWQAIYERERGSSPEIIKAEAVPMGGEVFQGGYFPMRYDPRRAPAKDRHRQETIEEMQRHVLSTVVSSFTNERVEFDGVPLLDLAALPHMLQEHFYYITHYEAVRDVNKLLRQPEIDTLLRDKLGQEYRGAIEGWMKSIATGGASDANISLGPLDNVIETLRNYVSVAIMGFSYTTMVSQTFGLASSIRVLGAQDRGRFSTAQGMMAMARGLVTYARLIKTGGVLETTRKVYEVSGEMRFRVNNAKREITDVMAHLKSGNTKFTRGETQLREFSMRLIGMVQMYSVDMPTWLGAYDMALRDGKTNEDAVTFADSVVRTSQGSGSLKDLPAIQRSRGALRLFTMFSTWLFTMYNLQVEGVRNAAKKGDRVARVMEGVAGMVWLTTIPAFAEALLRMQYDDDEAEDDLALWLALKNLSYIVAGVPFIGPPLEHIIMGEHRQTLTAITAVPESMGAALTEMGNVLIEGEEPDWRTVEQMWKAIGFMRGWPGTVQGARALDAAHGDSGDPYNFLIGDLEDNE